MQPHQQRVVDEKAQLDERKQKLGEFIEGNQLFHSLDQEEQSRLCRQFNIMGEYSSVLGERIEAFPSAT